MTNIIDSAPLLRSWNVPAVGSQVPVTLEARAGEVTMIVGANGAGKSELGTWLDRNGDALTHRVSAHRQLWFVSSGSGITIQRHDQLTQAIANYRLMPEARFVDHVGAERTDIVLFDLVSQVFTDNDVRVTRFSEGASPEEVIEAFGRRPLERLNAVLAAGGLMVRVQLNGQGFDAVRTDSGVAYPITQMSDGEKSAVLLAAEILAGQSGTVQIIDEPERHLHRAISSQVIQAVVASRPDCHFILLTHELDLVTDFSEQPNQTFVISSAQWSGKAVTGWELRPLVGGTILAPEARTAILGGRRRLVFIEGKSGNVDLSLYRLLYPSRQFVTAGGSAQVMRSVGGLRDAADHHWVEACGIVDGDHRNAEEVARLKDRSITPLPVAEVENLYYLDDVMTAVAQKHLMLLERDVDDGLRKARTEALEILKKDASRLTKELALTALRRRLSEKLPTILDPAELICCVTVESPYVDILTEVEGHIAADNLSELVRLLPVRNTPLPSAVAKHLGFQSAVAYQAFVRTVLRQAPELAEKLRNLINVPN